MGYSTVQDHRSMLFDKLRNSYYFKAIQETVKKSSVILDLGAGLGLHGLIANSCGAKKVYLVDPAPIFDITKMVVKENNLEEQVECISGKIEEATLPEKVDVIISVFTGNFLLTEDLLPSLFYARNKFLRTGGQMIPDRAKMIIVPVSADDYYAKHIDCWSKPTYDIEYSVARKYAVNSLYYDYPEARSVDFLAKPEDILDLDFMTANEAACRNKIEIKITENGIVHGFLGWFDTHIGHKWLSTSPLGKQTHWRQVFLPLSSPISVKKGDLISFELNRPEFGEWSWIVEINGKCQKHSTFLSKLIIPLKLMKKSDTYKPVSSEKGKITQKILELFNGGLSTAEIILKVEEDYNAFFATHTVTEQFVKNLVEKYT